MAVRIATKHDKEDCCDHHAYWCNEEVRTELGLGFPSEVGVQGVQVRSETQSCRGEKIAEEETCKGKGQVASWFVRC